MLLLFILIISLITCLNFLKSKKNDNFVDFNIKKNKRFNYNKFNNTYLGWKHFLRKYHSNFNVPNDNSFKNTIFENYLNNTPLRYDDIF